MGEVVLDSGVIIAAGNPDDVHHAKATDALRMEQAAGQEFVVPASVLAEVLVRPARVSLDRARHVRDGIVAAFGRCRELDDAIALAAAHLRATNRSLRLPDALVIATGIVDQADTILTTDRRWERIDDRVRLVG